MATSERVTVTLPVELIESIQRVEQNRSRFIAQAVENELRRRQRAGLLKSLENPHPDSAELAEEGFDTWGTSLPSEDEPLVDPSTGTEVHWIEGRGWVEEGKK